MLTDVEIRGPTSLVSSKSSAREHLDTRKQLSPPVVSPSRRLEMTTRLGLSVLQEQLAQASLDTSDIDKTNEKQGRLKTARLRSIGYVPIERRPEQATCLGIKPAFSDVPPQVVHPSRRPSTVPAGYQLSMKLFEDSMTRSYSARAPRQFKSSLSVSRDGGSILTSQVPKAQPEVQFTSPSPENVVDSIPYRRPESAPALATPAKRKISKPIPTLRQDTKIDYRPSFHVRSLTANDKHRRPRHPMELNTPTDSRFKSSVLEAECSPGLVVNPKPLDHPRKPVVSLRNKGKSKPNSQHVHADRTRVSSEYIAPPISKLSPLQGRLATDKIEPVIGSHIKVSPKGLSMEPVGSDSHSGREDLEWIPPSPIQTQCRVEDVQVPS